MRFQSDPAKREQRYDLMIRRSYGRYRRRVKRIIAKMKEGDILYISPRPGTVRK